MTAIDLRISVTYRHVPSSRQLVITSEGSLPATLNLTDTDWLTPTTSELDLVRRCWQHAAPGRGGSIKIQSSAPPSAGLATSATACVAALRAMTPLAHDPQDLAADAYHVERHLAGRLVGPMDFVPCALGGTSLVTCEAEAIAEVSHYQLPPGARVLIVDTQTPRDTGAVIAWKRRRHAEGDIGIRTYARDTTALVVEQAELLKQGADLDVLGQTLDAAQTMLREHMEVSTPLIEMCVSRLRANGALGVKITGTGLGGCLIALTTDTPEAHHRLTNCLRDLPVSTQMVAPASTGATGALSSTSAIKGEGVPHEGLSDNEVGDDQFRLTFGPEPELWCTCGNSTVVPSDGGCIHGTALAKLRATHRCGEVGSSWDMRGVS